MRQPEILLNPGSRPGMRGISQSQPQLDARGSYSSSGPQRDFATLPAYHEPPTFEEAVRQSVKKSKHAQSTGDLTGTRGGPPYIRSRPMSPDSDSTSDGEPLNRHPMFKVRPIAEATDHRYTSAPALQSPIESPTRRPPAVYARPQKKGILNEFRTGNKNWSNNSQLFCVFIFLYIIVLFSCTLVFELWCVSLFIYCARLLTHSPLGVFYCVLGERGGEVAVRMSYILTIFKTLKIINKNVDIPFSQVFFKKNLL